VNADVVVIGGGIGGSTLAAALTRKGCHVLGLERETKFRDRVRGENMLPWGVAAARRLGVLDDLLAGGGHPAPYFNMYAMGTQMEHRPLPQTTPSGEGCLNMYHPDLQEVLFAQAVKAGAQMMRGATVDAVTQQNGSWTVTFTIDGQSHAVTPRLVVGADGRFSSVRRWGGFRVKRDPDHLRIAGALVTGTHTPDDGAHLSIGPGYATFIAPLGNTRARMYFVYVGAMGDRKLSGGKEKAGAFLEACRSTGLPAEWFHGVEVIGPLAEFEGADQAVESPRMPSLALIGDAAAATDPSWGCGLSKTLVDVETLSRHLLDTADWDRALERYAHEHNDYYGKLHNVLSWMTELIWTGGSLADERRARVFPRMRSDPTGFPDAVGQGPFGPCDERARQLVLGEA
jgi:2-polyprenyl-6-methoxyphenol hydroxylase-like FAD-dependent oxidoreductase